MKTIDPSRVLIFIGVLAITALIINRHQARKESSAPKTAEDIAIEHSNYLARYLNARIARKPKVKMVAIAVLSQNGEFSRSLSGAISSRFKAEGIDTTSSFFTPAFVSDGLFDKAFAGSPDVYRQLELSNSFDALLLARQQVQYSTNPALENIITATAQLEVTGSLVAIQDGSQTWTLTANGAGFRTEEARLRAEERLAKQIANDPKMSLKYISQGN